MNRSVFKLTLVLLFLIQYKTMLAQKHDNVWRIGAGDIITHEVANCEINFDNSPLMVALKHLVYIWNSPVFLPAMLRVI